VLFNNRIVSQLDMLLVITFTLTVGSFTCDVHLFFLNIHEAKTVLVIYM